MLFYTLLLLTLTIVTDLVGKGSASKTTWQDCGSNDSILKFVNIGLEDVIKISKSEPFRLSVNSTQMVDMPGDAHVSIKIRKILNIFGKKLPINVPCINGIGSCEDDLCNFFNIHRKLACTIIQKSGQECVCPTKAGIYNAKDIEYQLPFKRIPTAILSLGNGDYTFDMEITHDNKQLACLKMTVVVKFV